MYVCACECACECECDKPPGIADLVMPMVPPVYITRTLLTESGRMLSPIGMLMFPRSGKPVSWGELVSRGAITNDRGASVRCGVKG